MKKSEISRRELLAAGSAAGLGMVMGKAAGQEAVPTKPDKVQVCVFSKHLQWLDYDGMAQKAADAGFDGLDLTVRPGGHVEPENVERDLPRAVRAVQRAGLSVPMMTTSVNSVSSETRKVLGTAAELGIGYYRMGYFRYRNGGDLEDTLDLASRELERFAQLNESLGIRGGYQNHAGEGYFGASIWDLWYALRNVDPNWVGSQFDLRHASVEGALNWSVDFRRIAPWVHTLAIKDYKVASENDELLVSNCPLGQGVAPFRKFLSMLRGVKFMGPVSLHLEYPLGGADQGKRELEIPESEVIAAMKADLTTLRSWLQRVGLA